MFSKTYGYAIRGILYLASTSENGKKIRIEEISKTISIPKYFLAKVMNKMVRAGILTSIKGPNGGFCINDQTLGTPLIKIFMLIDGSSLYEGCVLHLRNCSDATACPMHARMKNSKNEILTMLSQTTIGHLVAEEGPDFLRSITYK